MTPTVHAIEVDLELEAFFKERRTNEYLFGRFRKAALCGAYYMYYVPCCGHIERVHLVTCSLCGAQAEANRKHEELRQAEHRARMLNARKR